MSWAACLTAFYLSATRSSFPPIDGARLICSSDLLVVYFLTAIGTLSGIFLAVCLVDVALAGAYATGTQRVIRRTQREMKAASPIFLGTLTFLYRCTARLIHAITMTLYPHAKEHVKVTIPIGLQVIVRVLRHMVIWTTTFCLDALAMAVFASGWVVFSGIRLLWERRYELVRSAGVGLAWMFKMVGEEARESFRLEPSKNIYPPVDTISLSSRIYTAFNSEYPANARRPTHF
ncbi:hypothetical protein C8Q80DRAFT_1267820 [Daedaleopsis nitida]|nr:hypothetical protein C8Q80DRAFT_1267820 [Daedaleopsis nitida]